jgi:hypothetical protein
MQAQEELQKTYGLQVRLGPSLARARHAITNNRFSVDLRLGSVRGRLRGMAGANRRHGWFGKGDLAALARTGLTKKLLRAIVSR